MSPRRGITALLFAFACAIAAFVSSTLVSQVTAHQIDEIASSIAADSMPSIRHLAGLRTEVRQLEARSAGEGIERPDSQARIAAGQAEIDHNLELYLRLPAQPEERALQAQLDPARALAALDDAIDEMEVHVARGDFVRASAVMKYRVAEASDRLAEIAYRLIELHAEQASRDALRIQQLRQRSAILALVLDAGSAVLTIVAGILALGVARQHTRFLEEHGRLVERRADELEQFAGRVAHDILSPLGVVAMAVHLARGKSPDPAITRALERGSSGVERVSRIVRDLLAFARAGAQPEPGAEVRVREVVDDLSDELGPAASAANVELSWEPGTPRAASARVACAPGILTSLLANLVRNAIKYMGDARDRKVVLRVLERGSWLRFEVEDTGPGLPPELGDSVFEPYVRGRGSSQPGIGLGLSTVKRVVEAHGGTVGVRSSPGAGCLFWFELRRASDEPSPAPLPPARLRPASRRA